MTLLKFTPHMISNQPDQTAYLLNKLAEGHGGGDIGTLYNTTGQHTDGAMTQKATTNALGTKADAIAVGQALANKVDKEAGKGLSSNDFTNEELGKLNGIQAGAEVNVQSDWDQTDDTADDFIKNKPTIPAGVALYPSTGQNTDGAMTQKASSDLFNNAVYAGAGSVGTLTPWVDTSDIVDGAVTASKISLSSLNHITIPNDNDGTVVTLSNSQASEDTMYVAKRTDTDTSVRFGVGSGGINHGIYSEKQNRWLINGDVSDLFLGGVSVLTANGATNLNTNNINLNSTQYWKVGKYYCNTAAAGSTQSNNPSGTAYQMIVISLFNSARELSGNWTYMARIMFALNGVWYQCANTNGSGEVSYGAWRQLHNA